MMMMMMMMMMIKTTLFVVELCRFSCGNKISSCVSCKTRFCIKLQLLCHKRLVVNSERPSAVVSLREKQPISSRFLFVSGSSDQNVLFVFLFPYSDQVKDEANYHVSTGRACHS